jgi:hypothetical protein
VLVVTRSLKFCKVVGLYAFLFAMRCFLFQLDWIVTMVTIQSVCVHPGVQISCWCLQRLLLLTGCGVCGQHLRLLICHCALLCCLIFRFSRRMARPFPLRLQRCMVTNLLQGFNVSSHCVIQWYWIRYYLRGLLWLSCLPNSLHLAVNALRRSLTT